MLMPGIYEHQPIESQIIQLKVHKGAKHSPLHFAQAGSSKYIMYIMYYYVLSTYNILYL